MTMRAVCPRCRRPSVCLPWTLQRMRRASTMPSSVSRTDLRLFTALFVHKAHSGVAPHQHQRAPQPPETADVSCAQLCARSREEEVPEQPEPPFPAPWIDPWFPNQLGLGGKRPEYNVCSHSVKCLYYDCHNKL